MKDYYSIALEEACNHFKKKLQSDSFGPEDRRDNIIIRKSKTMYTVKNRKKEENIA
jgi:hypothetical protein